MICFTSVYGAYDPLRPHPDHPDVEAWVCYTDDSELKCDGWETVVEPARYQHPRLSAKYRKTHPPDADRSIWMDGSIELHNPAYIDEIERLLDGADMAFHPHPWRDNIRDEALASTGMGKYLGHDVHGQVAHYEKRKGFQRGLYASTTFARNHTPAVLQMGAAWMAHCELLTYQDQLSLPVLLDDYGITVAPIPHTLTDNPWYTWHGHRSDL